uniref:Uncharacterized protein n=1 Tax=Anguilla anguilla TaxID=7936 RepID=A0A0E9WRT7_ANGAN
MWVWPRQVSHIHKKNCTLRTHRCCCEDSRLQMEVVLMVTQCGWSFLHNTYQHCRNVYNTIDNNHTR